MEFRVQPDPGFDFESFRSALDHRVEIFDPGSFLRRIDGDRELFAELVAMVNRNLPEQFAMLRAAWESGDMAQMRLLSHRIKGSADNVSALRVREVAYLIEADSLAGRRAHLELLLGLLEEKIEEFREHSLGEI